VALKTPGVSVAAIHDPLTVPGLTELRLSVPEAGKRLLPLPIALWHKTVGKATDIFCPIQVRIGTATATSGTSGLAKDQR
jgi:hypothetical protein